MQKTRLYVKNFFERISVAHSSVVNYLVPYTLIVLSPILFIFFVSDIIKNLNCKKFKFADDGNLLVTGYTETQVYLNCQVILKQLERWCKNWRLAVNGDKTSLIYLNTEYPHAPRFFGEACKVSRSTKILGLVVDDKLNFNEHLQQVEGKGVGGSRSKERDRKSELVLRSTIPNF